MAHRRLRSQALLLATVLLALPAPAHAQLSWQALGTLTTGATNDALPGAEGDGADSYTEISPSLRLGLRSGRALHQLEYAFAATVYAANFDEGSSYANNVALLSLIQATPNLRLGLGAGFNQGQQNALSGEELLASGVQPSGAVGFIEPSASEGLDWQLDPWWSLSQTLEGRFYRELASETQPPQPDGMTIQSSLGLTRAFARSRVGGRVVGTYNTNLEYADTITPPAPDNDRCIALPAGGCRFATERLQGVELRAESSYDLSRSLALDLDAGLLEASTSVDWGQAYFQPTARVALRFAGARATAAISFAHTFEPSLRLGESFRYERLRLEGRLPIGTAFRERWFVTGAAGYDYAQQIEIAKDELGDSAHLMVAQAGLQWVINDSVSALARYELTVQTALAEAGGYTRHALLAGVEVRYPGSRQPHQRIRRSLPHQLDQRRWDEMFTPAPGQQRPSVSPVQPGG